MEIELAGINVPKKILDKILDDKSITKKEKAALTPEAISAAYARISRSTKSVDELIDEAIEDTDKARRSVTSILGMGHHSIADHAIFNFNIKGVSRLMVEFIEKRRLAGYTEKSQRYVTLKGDYIKPKEFLPKDLKKFNKLVILQNNFYLKYNEILFEYLKKKYAKQINYLKNSENDKKLQQFLKKLEGRAKEDARYSLSLATKAQLGCSYTGETLELSIRENKYGELSEQREFSNELYKKVERFAPSLIQLSDSKLFESLNKEQKLNDNNFKYTKKNLKELVEKTFAENLNNLDIYLGHLSAKKLLMRNKYVSLINSNEHDLNIIAALLFSNSKKNIRHCYAMATLLIDKKKDRDFIKKSLKYLSKHDKVPREFETSGFIYSLRISASCFAQLKRHRMMTLLSQDYYPGLNYTIPESIKKINANKELRNVFQASSDLFNEFEPKYGKAAEYCLTNGHRRRVLVGVNLREIYHISRLREDMHAQWEIRDKANKMCELAKRVAPITTILLGGKDKFDEIKKEAYK